MTHQMGSHFVENLLSSSPSSSTCTSSSSSMSSACTTVSPLIGRHLSPLPLDDNQKIMSLTSTSINNTNSSGIHHNVIQPTSTTPPSSLLKSNLSNTSSLLSIVNIKSGPTPSQQHRQERQGLFNNCRSNMMYEEKLKRLLPRPSILTATYSSTKGNKNDPVLISSSLLEQKGTTAVNHTFTGSSSKPSTTNNTLTTNDNDQELRHHHHPLMNCKLVSNPILSDMQ